MNRLGLVVVVVLAGTATACSESHGDDDAAITFDANLPDGGTPPPGPECGNGALEPGEMCDDGNVEPGDGCDASCAREAYCGDLSVDSGEACDDGNNRSGDGCRSDCGSDETCGNGIVDFAAGEVCDGAANCGADCLTVTGCGDGTLESPEVCDDGNTDRWDGCNAGCEDERTLVMSSLTLARRTVGCDFNGDGAPDNAFARALGLLSSAIGPLISSQIEDGNLILLLSMLGLEDPLGADDDDFRIAWLVGEDADDDATNNLAGLGQFRVQSSSLNADGSPLTSVQSSVLARALNGGPEDIPIPIGFFPIELRQGRIQGNTVATGGELFAIEDGLLCGGIPASLLALLGGFVGDMLQTDPPCDGGPPAELLDLIIAGGQASVNLGSMGAFPLNFNATPPDLDLDGDGLEDFVIERSGPADCQAVVASCTDGDGTSIPGRGCFSNPAIGDGYSSAFEFEAIQATLLGTVEAAPPPGG